MRHSLAAALMLLSLLGTPAGAWFQEGHELTALIASDHLHPETRAEIARILAYHPDAEVRTLTAAARWPDSIKEPSHPLHHLSRPGWHYVNRALGTTDPVERSGELLEQLHSHTRVVGDDSFPLVQRAVSLSWVVHLMGDIHQPLHNWNYYSERFPEGDLGGNRFPVVLGSESLPLHVFWDSACGRFLVPAEGVRLKSYARWFQEAEPREELERQSPLEISTETRSLAERIYADLQPGEPLSEEQIRFGLEASRRQLARSGYRLASLLNRLLAEG